MWASDDGGYDAALGHTHHPHVRQRDAQAQQLEGRPAVPVAVFTLGYLPPWVF